LTTETEDTGLDFDAADAFLNTSHKTAEGASVSPDGTAHEPGVLDLAAAGPETAEEGHDGSPAADPEDAEFEWGEEGAKTKAKLSELRTAYSERAAVTARAEAAAAAQNTALQKAATAETALTKMLEKAQARWAPYANIDFLTLSRDPGIDQETFEQVRKDAQEALADYQFLTQELHGATQARAAEQAAAHTAQARATLAELQHPTTGLPGFNGALYTKMVDHAVAAYGAPKNAVLSVVDPWAVRILHDAMLYRAGAEKATTQVAKVVNRPTRVLTPGAAPTAAVAGSAARRDLINKLQNSDRGLDDAADAFFATSRRAA
jgi:hypothetical protein